ncbi:MAG: nuclear transport factor 2 family protein [Anaerolineales bacterium]|nr:nuclear transport factor 2 family protein [Anaerolineales bacterium]
MKIAKVLLAVFVLPAILMACAENEGTSDKISVVENYIAATNEKNWDEAAKYLADDVEFYTPTGNCKGLDRCLGGPGGPDREDPSNFSVEGNTVRWEIIVTFPDFEAPARGEAVVEDGKIQVYRITAL